MKSIGVKNLRVKKEKVFIILYVIIIFIGIVTAYSRDIVQTFSMPLSKKIVIIDAGHGGFDPGKMAGKTLEKEINLAIAKKLQAYLEQGGCLVFMTRIDDDALSSEKKDDMWKRKIIANSSKADVFISIHQNAYHISGIKGAQVFYFNESDNSKLLAESIQDELKRTVDPYNQRTATSNKSYFVLRQTKMPAVIVECGFLTNSHDKSRLQNDGYQEKIAWGIYSGIVKYFEVADNKK